MAIIVNARDVLLQASAVRVVPTVIQITDVVGLPEAIAKAEKSLEITASAPHFSGASGETTTPTTITLTAVRKNGLASPVAWTVETGTATLTPSGGDNNTCSISGSSVTGASVTIRARVSDSGRSYDNRITIGKYGALTLQNSVSLVTQVTGQLNSGSITGLGALALLNTVSLNTQTTGALNGATQVTNLGTLAYANALAANQIGAGTLAVGVVYAGTVNVENLVGTTISGKVISGSSAVYIQGTNASAPVAMYTSGGTVGVISLNGLLSVNTTGGVSSFNVTGSGDISGGSISGGTTTTFRGTFRVNSTTTGYASIEAASDVSGTYVRLRSDNMNLITAGGAGMLSLTPSRVAVQTPFLNLAHITTDPGGSSHGDLAFFNNEVVIRISGAWYKLSKTPL